MTRIRWSVYALLVFGISACSKKNNPDGVRPSSSLPDDPSAPTPELIFNTGFQGSSIIAMSGQIDELRGTDATLPALNNWVTHLANHPNIGVARLYYEGGDTTQRKARIVADPLNPSNLVLNYKILAPHIDVPTSSQYTVNGILFNKKARIQMDLYGNNGLKEIYQSIRLLIPTDFNKLVNSTYPANGDWITLFEFWNNAHWNTGHTFPFRFGVALKKLASTSGSPFYFHVEGQKLANGFNTVWHSSNTNFLVPIGKWMTIEYYIKEGNKGKGRFYLAVTPDGGSKTVVYDLKNDTCHPDDPNPDGLSELNPIKLYTSNNMINQMNIRGGVFQVYWDDFKLWKNKRP